MATRKLTGTVVASTTDKTISVAIERVRAHRIYRKQYKITKKFLVHDEKNEASKGDVVMIEETRPISRRKRWKLSKILEKGTSV